MSEERRIEALTQISVDILARLVAVDSVSRHSNIPVLDTIEGYLKKYHIPCVRVPSPDGSKANLLARLGPETENGIVLSGHTDVVPVDGQDWDGNPFTLRRQGDRLYGRGTADMKSFLAVSLAMAPEFLKLPLARPIWLAFSYDEEVGCLGAPHLLRYIGQHIPRPSFAIIGEPTLMQVVTAHKGVLSFETTVHGLEGHSSQPHLGVNAVQIACELVHFLTGLAKELSETGRRDARFDPPTSTVHVGVIHGGTARNIIPKECRLHWEIRPLPGDDPDVLVKRFDERCAALLAQMQAVHPEAAIATRPISHMAGVTLPEAAQSYCRLVMRCAQRNEALAVSFGTEAGVFNDHGVPAIICGPGSIEQAHKPNEFIDAGQIRACVAFMLRLAEEVRHEA